MDKHPIDKLFHSKLKNLERRPNAQAWDKLEGLIDKNQTKKKRRGIVLWMSVAASLLLIISSIGVFVHQYYNTSTKPYAVSKHKIDASSNQGLAQNPTDQSNTSEDKSEDLRNTESSLSSELESENKELIVENQSNSNPEVKAKKEELMSPELNPQIEMPNLEEGLANNSEITESELPLVENGNNSENNPKEGQAAKKKYQVKVTLKLSSKPQAERMAMNDDNNNNRRNKRRRNIKNPDKTKPKGSTLFGIRPESIIASIGK